MHPATFNFHKVLNLCRLELQGRSLALEVETLRVSHAITQPERTGMTPKVATDREDRTSGASPHQPKGTSSLPSSSNSWASRQCSPRARTTGSELEGE